MTKRKTRARSTPPSRATSLSQQVGPGPLTNKRYRKELAKLQLDLIKMQEWIVQNRLKVLVIFEGRDAAGKGGVIKRITESLNPRVCRVVALATPTERERTQWYFQRYVTHLPAAGEMVLFDRSWYNRAGVERVMGFATNQEVREFFRSCPEFERMLIRADILLIKYWFLGERRGAEASFRGSGLESNQALEVERDGPPVESSVVRLCPSEGRDVRRNGHEAGTMVRGGSGRQAAGAAELHPSPPQPGAVSLPRRRATGDQGAQASEADRVRAPTSQCPNVRAGDLLNPEGELTRLAPRVEGQRHQPFLHDPEVKARTLTLQEPELSQDSTNGADHDVHKGSGVEDGTVV